MLGIGALGQFPIGGGPTPSVVITTYAFTPLSEPVRFKRDPRAHVALTNQFFSMNPLPRVSFGWYGSLTLPVRKVPRNPAALSPYHFWHPAPNPFVATGWRANLSEPKRFKKGLHAAYQQPFAFPSGFVPGTSTFIQGWYVPYSEPKRFKKGLSAAYQQTLAYEPRMLPTPDVTAIMAALETGLDTALFSLYVVPSNEPDTAVVSAAVSIEEVGGSNSATSIVES